MFRGTWGRADLPTGSFEAIIASITKKLLTNNIHVVEERFTFLI